jgi:hypothetical protein
LSFFDPKIRGKTCPSMPQKLNTIKLQCYPWMWPFMEMKDKKKPESAPIVTWRPSTLEWPIKATMCCNNAKMQNKVQFFRQNNHA